MAWPKRGTRNIVVDDIEYLWHYDAHCIWCSDDVFTVGQQGKPFVLYIDSYAFGEEIRPKNIANAIKWAVLNEWNPTTGPNKSMSYDQDKDKFYWLPDGVKHASCIPPKSDSI